MKSNGFNKKTARFSCPSPSVFNATALTHLSSSHRSSVPPPPPASPVPTAGSTPHSPRFRARPSGMATAAWRRRHPSHLRPSGGTTAPPAWRSRPSRGSEAACPSLLITAAASSVIFIRCTEILDRFTTIFNRFSQFSMKPVGTGFGPRIDM
jgi:hypothetical protein